MKKLKGFTLIELLIVIALLGALAAGLLAAIDPFEQLKKGTDTSIRGQAETVYNASIAYYAQRNELPFATGMISGNLAGTEGAAAISALAAAGELKSDFFALAGAGRLSSIFVTVPSAEKIIVCYLPQSKAFRNDLFTKYDITGGTMDTSLCGGTSTSCYQCFQ